MKLIVGLGNPEPRYFTTRHNAGFWTVDRLAIAGGARFNQAKNLYAHVTKVNIHGEDVVLAQPDTYMNLSGQAVQAILHWYKIAPQDLLVVHDDVALPLGKIRYQSGGGAGGQHGVENIIQMLGGNKGFDRLKIGVGPDPGGDRRADYVLSPIPEADRELKEKVLSLVVESIDMWVTRGAIDTMNKYNKMDLRPDAPVEEKRPRKTKVLLQEQHAGSGRHAVFEDSGAALWLYLTKPNLPEPEFDVWVYNRIPAPEPDLIKNFKGQPPPAAKTVLDDLETTTRKPSDFTWSFVWSEDGNSVALFADKDPVAFIAASLNSGFNKHLIADCPWGKSWSAPTFAELFS
jgi:peptidyl-tRNA hydrolase, PTH1 family